MNKYLLILIQLLLLVNVVNADQTLDHIGEIADKCKKDSDCITKDCFSKYTSDSEKVNCFIEATKTRDEEIPKTTYSEPEPKWKTSYAESEMDDSKTIIIYLEAENYVFGYPNKSYQPKLFIRCLENQTQVYISLGMSPNPEYGKFNSATVRIRLDNEKPFKQTWKESTDGKALFAPKAISLAKKLNKSDKMLFEFTPYNSNPQLVELDVRGLEPYLMELSKTCNWKL